MDIPFDGIPDLIGIRLERMSEQVAFRILSIELVFDGT